MKLKIIVIGVLLTLILPGSGLADEQSDQVKNLESEVLLMKRSFDELFQLLKSQQHQTDELQKLQIAVTYLSFRSRSIEVKEYDLRQRKESRARLEKIIAKIEEDPDEWDKRDKTFQSNNLGQSSLNEARPSERRIEMLRERIESLDTDILKAELEIQEVKEGLAVYEAYIQEKLNIEN
jgi:hypothetical protein